MYMPNDIPPEAGATTPPPAVTQNTVAPQVTPASGDDVGQNFRQELVQELTPSTDIFGGPQTPELDPSALEAITSGLSQVGVIVGLGEYASELSGETPSSEADPDFKLKSWVESDPGLLKLVASTLRSNEDGDKYLSKELLEAPNEAMALHIIDRIKKHGQNRRVSEASDWIPWLLGSGLGISLDVLAGAAIGGPVGAGAQVIKATTQAARTTAAIRVGRLGMLEGGAESAAQGLTDPSITNMDILINSGLGGAFGAVLGAAMPGLVGGVVTASALKKQVDDAGTEVAAMQQQAAGEHMSAGAAKADEVEEFTSPTAIKGTGSTVLDRGPLKALEPVRTPKRLLADVIRRGTEGRKKGLTGNDRLSSILTRMLKISTQTGEDQAGVTRTHTMQEGLEMMQAKLTLHETTSKKMYDGFIEKLGGNKLSSLVLNNDLTGDLSRKLGNTKPSQAEMREVADDFAQARGEGDTGSLDEIMGTLEGRIPEEFIEDYRATIKAMADHDDDWYLKFGEAEVELGFIDPKDFGPGYRPQNWNTQAVNSHLGEVTDQMEKLIADKPQMEWVAETIGPLARRAADDAGEDAASVPLVNPDDTWETFVDRMAELEPNLIQDLLEDWDKIKKARIQDRLEDTGNRIEQELNKFVDDAAETVLQKSDEVQKGLSDSIAEKTAELKQVKHVLLSPSLKSAGTPDLHKATQKIDELSLDISRLEESVADEVGKVRTLKALRDRKSNLEASMETQSGSTAMSTRARIAEVQAEVRSVVTKAGKQGRDAKDVQRKLTKAQRDIAVASGRLGLRDTAAGIMQAISKKRSPGGFHVDDAIQTSKHFKRRQVNLKGVRHKPEWKKFLNRDSSMNMEIYTQSVGRQLEMRRKYMPQMQAEGLLKDGDTDIEAALGTYLRQAFDDDRRLLKETLEGEELAKELDELEKEFTRGRDFMTKAFAEFTRSDYVSNNETADRVVSIVQSASVSTMLGKILLSSLADPSILAFQGTRVGTGFLDLFRQLRNKGVLEAIHKKNELLAMVLRGERVMSGAMMTSRFDLDSQSLEVPGGMLASIQRKASSLAQVTMWTNLLHPWNRMIRSAFGVGFMRQISRDMEEYASLRPDQMGYYAKHGIGKAEAVRMKALYNRHSYKVNGVRIPDLEKWAQEGNDDLVDTFYRAANGAGNEALLDPGLGDRPFLRSSPLGKLVLQFQGFTFAAGERFFAPLVQQALMHPADARVFTSAMLGLAMAALGNEARLALAGRESELSKALDGDGQAAWVVFKNSWLRSPFAVGMSGMAMDNMGTMFANPVNSAYQGITGSDGELLSSEFLRYRQGQGFYNILGPGAGLALGTVPTMIGKAAEGDMDKLKDMTLTRTPVLNSLPFLLMGKLSEQLIGD